MNIYFIFPCRLSERPPRSEKSPPWDSFKRSFFSPSRLAPVRQSRLLKPALQSSLFFLFPLSLQYGWQINNSWPVIRASSIEDLLMEGRCSASVPGGMLRVVVSAPICQNAIRQTMEALISTSRPIIFKWLLAEECNQSITDKILLKASLSLSLPLSCSLSSSIACLFCFLFVSGGTGRLFPSKQFRRILQYPYQEGRRSMAKLEVDAGVPVVSGLTRSGKPRVELVAWYCCYMLPLRFSAEMKKDGLLSAVTSLLSSEDSGWQRPEIRQLSPGDITWWYSFPINHRRCDLKGIELLFTRMRLNCF